MRSKLNRNFCNSFFPDRLINLTKRWAKSGDPDFMWAAGAAIWRIYDGLYRIWKKPKNQSEIDVRKAREAIDNLLDNLTTLVSSVDHFNNQIRLAALAKILEVEEDSVTKELQLKINKKQEILLEQQLSTWVIANINSILHAIRQIMWVSNDDAVCLVKRWLVAENDQNQTLIGTMAGYQLFRDNSSSEN